MSLGKMSWVDLLAPSGAKFGNKNIAIDTWSQVAADAAIGDAYTKTTITSSDIYGPTICVSRYLSLRAQILITTSGTLVGALSLQGSNFGGGVAQVWQSLTAAPIAVSGATGQYNLKPDAAFDPLNFSAIRLFFDYTSGSGIMYAAGVCKAYA